MSKRTDKFRRQRKTRSYRGELEVNDLVLFYAGSTFIKSIAILEEFYKEKGNYWVIEYQAEKRLLPQMNIVKKLKYEDHPEYLL